MELHEEIWRLWRRAMTPDPETTYICSLAFTGPNPELFPDDEYSPKEVIIYNGISPHVETDTPDHALILKKNVRRGRFELHRYYHNDGSVEVIFRGSSTKAFTVMEREIAKYRPELLGRIKKCEHRPPRVDRAECPIFRRRIEKLKKRMEEKAREIMRLKEITEAYQEMLRRAWEEWGRLRKEMEDLASMRETKIRGI
jgi:hypothetical protein